MVSSGTKTSVRGWTSPPACNTPAAAAATDEDGVGDTVVVVDILANWFSGILLAVLQHKRYTETRSTHNVYNTDSDHLGHHLGQLSLPSLQDRLIEYQPFQLGLGGARSPVSAGR